MKRIKKVSQIFLMLAILIPTLILPEQGQAKTLQQLKDELQAMEEKYNKNEEQQKLTKQQMAEVQANIDKIKSEMKQINTDIENLTNEIAELEVSIKKKDQEIKDLVNFVQVSNGESAYLEYAFGAKSFTDFIYRISVSEQLASYNEELITSYNKMIKENENKKVELKEKNESLTKKQGELDAELSKLGSELNTLSETSVSIKEEIEKQKKMIQDYQEKGVQLHEDVSKVVGFLPSNTAFYRPLVRGHVNSEWGGRAYGSGFHEGIDLSVSPTNNVPVYASANGVVAAIFHKNSCGGNMVVVHHNVNGASYTTVYAHLLSITVSSGQYVTTQTQVGVMGGGPETWGYDGCTTGYHVHFSISTGLYGVDYKSWSTLISRSINPRSMVNFPAGLRNEWSSRYTAY